MLERTYHRDGIMRISFVIIGSAAIFFSVYKLTESPPVWYDEGFYVQAAANIAAGRTDMANGMQLSPDNVQHVSIITVGYPLIYPLAGWMKIFGANDLVARSLMVVFILAFLLTGYFFVRRLFGRELALGALALSATLPTLYGNGKTVLGEVPGLFYLALFFLFLNIASSATARKYLWLILTGLAAGLCVATKPNFLVLLPAIAVGAFIAWRRATLSGKEVCIAVVAGALPMLLWVFLQFQAGDSVANILGFYINPYQLPNLSSVILGNIRNLFTSLDPLYLMAGMGLWTVALWVRKRERKAISTEEIIAFIFSLLTIASYTRTTGWYRYLFQAQAVVLLFFPNALLITARWIIRARDPKKLVVVAIVLLTLAGAYQVMFKSFVAESYNRHKTAFLESYFATVPPTTSYFFYEVPEAAIFIHGTNYYQYITDPGGDIGKEELPVVAAGKVDNVMLLTDTYKAMAGDTLFSLYTVAQTNHDYTILERK